VTELTTDREDEPAEKSWQRPVLRGSYLRGAATPAVVPYGRGFPDVALMATGPSVQRGPGEPVTAQGYPAVVGGQWIDENRALRELRRS
jgi:kumamolisin